MVSSTLPTSCLPFLEMADLQQPKEYQGREVAPMRGRSMTRMLSGDSKEIYSSEDSVGAEMAGGKWLRRGDYKAVLVPPPFGPGEWQLFNLAEDPGETNNLAATSPELLEELTAVWQQYAHEVGVVEVSGDISR